MKKMKLLPVLLLCNFVVLSKINAQSLPGIFDDTPKDTYPATTLASFPVKTFLENIAVDDKGDLFVTSLEEGKVYKLNNKGDRMEYAAINGKLAGIVYTGSNTFYITGWNDKGTRAIFYLHDQKIEQVLEMKDALFLNGITKLDENILLICDAYKGVIWQFDITTRQAAIWLKNELLERIDTTHSMPAANGIKLYDNTVYVTNTDKQLLIRIPLNGLSAGKPVIWMDKLNLDDIAFDKAGNLYGTTHIYNSVLKITPAKKLSIIATEAEGVTGSTALAFGNTNADKNILYVTTNGGMSLPPASGLENAKIVKIVIP